MNEIIANWQYIISWVTLWNNNTLWLLAIGLWIMGFKLFGLWIEE